ncbi:TPA: ankyrin repeat domain-containing protein [Legionella bozemanae]
MQVKMERLPSGQKWFINSMKRLGYRGNRNGVCHGLATLFMVYCQNNKADSFFNILVFMNENRHLIKREAIDALRARIAKNPQGELTETEKQLLEVASFCETVEILQHPMHYPQLFPNELAIQTQDVEESLSVLGLDTWNNEYYIEELAEQVLEKGKFYAKFTSTGLDYVFINPTGDEIRGTLLAEDLNTVFKSSEQHETSFKTLNTSFKKVIDLIEKKNGHQVNPEYFRKKNIFSAGDVCGVYNQESLEKLIQSFAKIAPQYQPVSFSISACRHAVELTYVNNQWVVFDPNRKFKLFNNDPSSAKEMAALILGTYKSLAKDNKGEYLGLSFAVSVNNKDNALKVKEAIDSIQANTDIHKTGFSDLRRIDADGKTWAEIATKTDNLIAIKKMVAGLMDDDDVIKLILNNFASSIRRKKRDVYNYFIDKLKEFGLELTNLSEKDIGTIIVEFTSQPLNEFKQLYQQLAPKLGQEQLTLTLERCLINSVSNNNKLVLDYLLDDVCQLKSPDRELKLLECAILCEKPDLALAQIQKLDALKEEEALSELNIQAYGRLLNGTFAKYLQNQKQKPYPMYLAEINMGVILQEEQLRSVSEKYGNIPILIKQGNTIMIYGLSKENKWQLNPLKNPSSEVMQEIDKLQFGGVGSINLGELHKEIRKNNLHITSTTSLLFSAVKSRNVELLNKIIEKGVDLNIPNKQGFTPLMLACRHGFDDIVQILLANGAKTALTDKKGNTVLHHACIEGYTNIAQQIISSNPELINLLNTEKVSPLVYAISLHEDIELTQLLLANKAEANLASLYLACVKGRLGAFEVLLEHDPSILKNDSRFILAAVNSGNEKLVKLLLEPKLPEHQIDYEPLPLFRIACKNGNADIARIFAERHPDILKSPEAEMAFLIACSMGNLGVVKLFVEKLGVEYIETITNKNNNALTFAIIEGRTNVAEYLLDCCPNFNRAIKTDPKWLTYIVREGHLPLLELVANKYHVDIKMQDSEGISAIHRACEKGHIELVKWLVEKDHSVLETPLPDGRTPLFLALSLKDNPGVASYLIEQGANIYAVDQDLNTAIHDACTFAMNDTLHSAITRRVETHQEETIAEIKKMAELRNAKAQTPLMFAVVFNNPSLVSLFLECKADITLVDQMGNNALHLLCKNAKDKDAAKEMLKIILYTNPELLNTINGAGMTPLMLVAQSGRVDIFKILLKFDPPYVRSDEKTIFDCSPNEETTRQLLQAIIEGSKNNQDQLKQLIEVEVKKQHISLVLPMLMAVYEPQFTLNILSKIVAMGSDTQPFKSKAIQEKAKAEIVPLLSFLSECIEKYEINISSDDIDSFVNAIRKLMQTEDEQDYLMVKEHIEGVTSKVKETVKIQEPTPSDNNPYRMFQPATNAPVIQPQKTSESGLSFSPGGNNDTNS